MTTRWAPAKRDTLRELATEIGHNYGRGRVIVAVDGPPSGTGGSAALADDLADALRESGLTAFRASVAAFSRRPEGAGRETAPELDESVFRRVLIEPFRLGGSTGWVEAAYDAEADRPVESSWVTGPADAVLVVDGSDLSRAGLAGIWHYRVWVSVGDERPTSRATASAVIDNTDPEHPRRRFDDAC
jgi:uridine kinase